MQLMHQQICSRRPIQAPTGVFPPNESAGLSARSCVTSQVHEAFPRAILADQFRVSILTSQSPNPNNRNGNEPLWTATSTSKARTRTRTNTNPNDTEANAAGRSGNARALRKQSKCGVIHEGEGHWPNFSHRYSIKRNGCYSWSSFQRISKLKQGRPP